MPTPRPRPSPDPVRQRLVEVRKGLLRLHKALIDAERAAFERRSGPLSNGQFLQALIQDPYFEWLRPFSALIVEIDEALADREAGVSAGAARDYVQRVGALVEDGDDSTSRYAELRQRSPDVLVAHVELFRRIEAAAAD